MEVNLPVAFENEKCTGCFACANICPVNAIESRKNGEGFLYPFVDKAICLNCEKCISVCPIDKQIDNVPLEVYAAYADEETRQNSSSGGVMSVLANFIFEKRGIVYGASYYKDFSVKHIFIDKKKDYDKILKSKYVQSDITSVYKMLENHLCSGRKCIFSGTPCQVDAVKQYFLSKNINTEKLIFVDILCHGVPSPEVFQRYLKENFDVQKIANIDFRNKDNGWILSPLTLTITFADGSSVNDSRFSELFLNNICLRKSCSTCKYCSQNRAGDITLGDFWGIEEISQNFNDNKGTSLVIINTKKGKDLFESCKKDLKKIEQFPISVLEKTKNEVINHPVAIHKNRNQFFELMKKNDLNISTKIAFTNRYDIVVVGCGFAGNYGAGLTTFAVCELFKSFGLSVLLLDKPKFLFSGSKEYDRLSEWEYSDKNPSRNANIRYQNVSKIYNTFDELKELNDICDTFVVPSDQAWNHLYFNEDNGCDTYFYLSWVNDNKKKIALSTSFGFDYWSGDAKSAFSALEYLQKFDAISVREDSGVELLRDTFNLSGTHLLDPVFSVDKNAYSKLLNNSTFRCENDFLFTYFLDADENINTILSVLSKKYTRTINTVNPEWPDSAKLLTVGETHTDFSLEDFLWCIANAKMIFTTSFHATCFAIIFHKPFICMPNHKPGVSRFTSLLSLLNLKSRAINSISDLTHFNFEEPIDWKNIDEILGEKQKNAIDWFLNAYNAPKIERVKYFDLLREIIFSMKAT